MKAPLFLALDIGTSSVRAGIYDCDADVFPETMVKNSRQLTATTDGGFEIDVDEAFDQLTEAIDDVIKKCPDELETIGYSATSSFWHSLLGIDKEGNPTTKLFAWAETRPAKFVQTLRTDLDETQIHNRTGCRFHSSYWTAKLLWLRKEHPGQFNKTDKWVSFCDYVALKMFGNLETSVSMASGTGVFDIRKNIWDKELLEYLKIDEESLPKIVKNDRETFRLNKKYSERWKRLRDTKWFLAIGDGAGNNIGANCVSQEKAALMIGTSGAMRVAFEGDVPKRIPHGLWCYRIDRTRLIVGGALSDGGGLYGWLKKNFRLKKNDDKTEAKIAKRKPDQHGMTFLPFLAGERSTGYNDFASGAIIGLKHAHNKNDIVQAALESVAYRFARIYEQLNEILEIKEIVASGGALRESPIWTQIICDTLGQDLNLPNTREASSRGVVLLAAEAIGVIKDLSQIPTPNGEKFIANENNHLIYQSAIERHEKFYSMLIGNQ